MKLTKLLFSLFFFTLLFSSCEKDEEILKDTTASKEEKEETEEVSQESDHLAIEEFIYDGMNEIYLYKADVPELADNYFSSDSEKDGFLMSFNSPEDLFEELKSPNDRFSFITDDYKALEDSFDGVSGSTGIEFGLGRISGTSNLFAYLQYILPGTSAEEAGLTRGTVFTEVDGQKLTINNYADLLGRDSFTINVGKIEDGYLEMTEETVTLEDTPYTMNPVYISKVFEMEGRKIGYLMYNSFISDFDDELNAAFANFKAKGVTDLILDLRYNGGGSVESAIDLASMITGQFEGKVFMKEQWNEKYQEYYETHNPERLVNRFDATLKDGTAINSLKLPKVYILTAPGTASASELVINGLEPYIDVIQIGETTTGKFQASVTLYDSPTFGKENINEDHSYAIQPLVFKSVNAAGKTDYLHGLDPDIIYAENLSNMGVLGDPSEPLLAKAINQILGKQDKRSYTDQPEFDFIRVEKEKLETLNYQKMYIEEVPEILQRNL